MADIERAATSFPATTGLGIDCFSPGAVLRLPQALLQQLVDLLNKAEALGEWDEALALVIVFLSPKDDGGRVVPVSYPPVDEGQIREGAGVGDRDSRARVLWLQG